MAALAPLRSRVGATTTTSWSRAAIAAASAWMPADCHPSSLVARTRTIVTVANVAAGTAIVIAPCRRPRLPRSLGVMQVVIVGGGIVGTMHAWFALGGGHHVIQIEADAAPRRATVRNFGLIWVSGRAPGRELALALRARELWEGIGSRAPGVGFRADGSLTVAHDDAAAKVLADVAARPDAAVRGFELLDAAAARRRNPSLRGDLKGALWCAQDAIVEPTAVLPALREVLSAGGGYRFIAGRRIVDVSTRAVRDHLGDRYDGDLVLVCPGAEHATLGPLGRDASLRRCRLQMLQTEPLGERLATALADGDSLRYYPAFAGETRDALPAPDDVVSTWGAQLLVAQRATGELTIGDTHAYDEPFDFAVDEEPYAYLVERASAILGRALPRVLRRWAGIYSQAADGQVCLREELASGVIAVTGLGGRGMTLAPAVAEQTFAELAA